MDICRSPAAKQPKRTGTTFNEIRDEVNQVVQLRKISGQMINDVWSSVMKERMEALAMVEVKVSSNSTYDIPDFDKTFEGIEEARKKIVRDEAIKLNVEHIKLLDLVEARKSCPISKIIDQI